MVSTITPPTASVTVLPLTKGLFLFSVRSHHSSQRIHDQGGISLPAMQISAAPGAPVGQIDFMMSPQTRNGWLSEPNDQIVARVTEPSAMLLLTSVMIPGMSPLEIEIQRLGQADEPPAPTARNEPARKVLPPLSTQKSIRLEITSHVQNHGDMTFAESQWAGLVGQGLWIESFSVLPLEDIPPDMIEYKAVTSTGVETAWVSGGLPCGTRGIGVPLVAFAIRLKAHSGLTLPVCEYGAVLLSGAILGPARNGAPCRSPNIDDPIGGIWVSIEGGAEARAYAPHESVAQNKPHAGNVKPQGVPETEPMQVIESATKKRRAPVGPRFSVFRETDKSE